VLQVTADTNILVSAIVYPRGNPRRLLQMALSGDIDLCVSHPIIEEMADVLARKFRATPQDIAEAMEIVTLAARTVRPTVRLDVIKEDPDDNRILECAVSAGSDCIVTGDKDLLRLKSYDSIRIPKVSDFMDILNAPPANAKGCFGWAGDKGGETVDSAIRQPMQPLAESHL
jgi:putative PIN family toxin of toxin-antitoxin system